MSSRKSSKLSLKKPAAVQSTSALKKPAEVQSTSALKDLLEGGPSSAYLFPHSPKRGQTGSECPPPLIDTDQYSVITIHSDTSTVKTPANMWENFDAEMIMAQLEGSEVAEQLYSSERVIPTPQLSEVQKSPTPPPEFRAPLMVQSVVAAEDPRLCAKRRRESGGKNLEVLRENLEGTEVGYIPEIPTTTAAPIQPAKELAKKAHHLLQQMLGMYADQLKEAQARTFQLEREVEAARMAERRIEGDMKYISNFSNFCSRK